MSAVNVWQLTKSGVCHEALEQCFMCSVFLQSLDLNGAYFIIITYSATSKRGKKLAIQFPVYNLVMNIHKVVQ